MLLVALFVAHWMLAVFIQSSFHHRYASHRMFSMPRVTERVFHLAAWLVQGPSYLSPRAYALLHREHHAYSDTPRDPHSPLVYRNPLRMMWHTAKRYTAHLEGRITPEARFLIGLPEWRTVERIASTWSSRIFLGVLFGLFYLWLSPSVWLFVLLLPAVLLMGPLQGAIVNWCGHRWGYRNFDTRDGSRNTLPLDFVTGGELFQNNHHGAAGRINFAWRWFEVDPTYLVLRVLDWLRVIRIGPAPSQLPAAA